MSRMTVYRTDVNEMDVAGSSVGVIGGSIAGCAAAIALGRLGCEVTILERSSSGLADRGSGIAVPRPLRDELIAAGYLPRDYPCWVGTGRLWLVADGSDAGDVRWRQPGALVTNNWGTLWRGLRDHVGGNVNYIDGAIVEAMHETSDAVVLDLADGSERHFDIVVGADGYRSVLRSHIYPDSRQQFAGYVLWRGNFPAENLSDREAWNEVLETGDWLTVGFEGGHMVMYPIPDFDGSETAPLRVNWAMYAPCPAGLTINGPSSIPPGAVDDDCYAQLQSLLSSVIPPRLRPLFNSPQSDVSIQPVYDESVDAYTSGRLLLIGDAATLTRPHTGSGATKAMQDARLLEYLGSTHLTWGGLLEAYDEDRSAAGRTLVELGRRIGRDQVEETPPWSSMEPEDFEAWTAATLSGDTLYFWGDAESSVDTSS